MRRIVAIAAVLAVSITSATSAPLFASGARRIARVAVGRGQATGTVAGRAEDSRHQALPNYTVRIRNLANGNIAGSTTTGAVGDFTFVGLVPGNYAIEIVNGVGDIVGTSASIAVGASSTVSITVTLSAASKLAGAAVGGGGAAIGAGHGISTALIVVAAAGAAGVVGLVIANRPDASPAR